MNSSGDTERETDISHSSTPEPRGAIGQLATSDTKAAMATTTTYQVGVTAAAALPVHPPSTNITDLPNEILRDIFLDINGEFSKTLYSLSLTCKHFRAIVEEYCEPEYNLRGKWLENAIELLDQLCERPNLKHSVRVLWLQYQHAFPPAETPAETLALANRLGLTTLFDELSFHQWDEGPSNMAVALLTASLLYMETCHVKMFNQGDGDFDHMIQAFRSEGIEFERLRNLTLWNENADVSAIFNESYFHFICGLPSLVRLQIYGLYFQDNPYRESASLSLEYLEMDDHQENFDLFQDKRFMFFRRLKHLRLRITDSQLSYSDEARPCYVENLRFLKHSLETLELFTNEPYCYPDGTIYELPKWSSQPSFRNFRRLKTLTLTDISLVGIDWAGPQHTFEPIEEVLEHLAWMLPSSLETLTHLVWDGPIGSNDEDMLQQYRSRWPTTWAAVTPDMFPTLKVVVVQKYGLHGLNEERKVIWKRED